MPDKKEEILFDPFPKQQEFIDAVFSGNFSFVLFGGAIRGGKTFSLLAIFIILSRFYPGSRWFIVRKNLPAIKTNLYPVWDKIKPSNFIKSHNHSSPPTITFKNGSQIIFFPESFSEDKDLNRWKGLEANGFGFEEINECQQVTLFKAFERAGSYIIKGLKTQPKPIVVATCNPTMGWVKDLVYTPYKTGTLRPEWLYIQSRIYDNTPLLQQQPEYLPNLKKNLNHYEYEVFVEGNWDVQLKTGGEFLRNFEMGKHLKTVEYSPETTVHISVDSNVYPYIAITCHQLIRVDGGWIARQIHEIPCEDPDNTASQAGKAVVRWLKAIGYNDKVFMYGDRSTKSRNNIDDNKRSFFQIFNENIVAGGYQTVDRILSYAPSVSSIGDFVNAILAGEIKGIGIEISESCKKSINDYIESKTDKDGGILKVRVNHPTIANLSFEKNGHLTDTFKDFLVSVFHDEYKLYLNRHKKLISGGITQVNRGGGVTL